MELPVIVEEDDLVFFMTAQCNSNCIMCPMSEDSRRNATAFGNDAWEQALTLIQDEVCHITITGGEPFLQLERLVWLMAKIAERWPQVPVLVLTNGRALSLKTVQEKIEPYLTEQYRFGIPIHADTAELHDQITQSAGSFHQTMTGLWYLAHRNVEIEVRIVCHQINQNHLSATCHMLAISGLRLTRINILAMEMNGCAARNRERLWADYGQLYMAAEPGIYELIKQGIDVGLYDFPLCALPKYVWTLAKQSISPSKVRYDTQCDTCAVKSACGGLFRATFLLGVFKTKPVQKEG